MVLQAVCDAYENKFERAIIVSSDGDYASLVKFLEERKKLRIVLSPHDKNKCSILLKRTNLSDVRRFMQIEKAPSADRTAQGSFS